MHFSQYDVSHRVAAAGFGVRSRSRRGARRPSVNRTRICHTRYAVIYLRSLRNNPRDRVYVEAACGVQASVSAAYV